MDTAYLIRNASRNTVSHCRGVARSSGSPSGFDGPLLKRQEKPAKKQKPPQKNTSKLNASLNLNSNDILSCLRSAYAQLSNVEQQAVERYGLNEGAQLLVNQQALHLHCKVVKKKLEQAATLIKRLESSNAPQFNIQQKNRSVENAG